MFLNELEKSEGIAFLQLVKQLANIDTDFSKDEENLYQDYLKELNINKLDVSDVELGIIEKTLKDSCERHKNIIYFELVGLAFIDGEFDKKEKVFLYEIEKKLNIKNNKITVFTNYFENFIDIYNFSVVDAESKIDLLKEQAEKLLA